MKKAKIYHYSACSTCKKALQFLKKNNIAYEEVAIVEQPPSKTELKNMLSIYQGDLKKLFNTSGLVYREKNIGEKLRQGMSEADALELLSKNGKLIKRPFLLFEGLGLVGFKEAEWKKLF